MAKNQNPSLNLPKKFIISLFILLIYNLNFTISVQILSKSKLEKCEKASDSPETLNCTKKVVVNMAVPSGSSGGEASIVAEIVEVEENSTSQKMQTVRIPPIVTVSKSAAYAVYDITYIRDVPYKPVEYYVQTRKCESDAGEKVVGICERLRDQEGHIIEHTQPTCCPCGTNRRVPSSCGNIFDKVMKGKPNTAHCLRFPGDWFHVFGIGKRSLGFSVRIEVKKGSKVSEVIVGPENRTVSSGDNFLRVSLVGDFVGYTSIPTLEDFYLVIPRQGGPGQPPNLGNNFSMWMLLERVRFTLDGLECNKIGVSYEAYNGQPNFCASPLWSCLHNQLWNFWEADQSRVKRHQTPLYGVEGRFERINQYPDAGTHSFAIGITEVLNSNLLIELSADDIEYVFQRSPGKILSVTVPTFEALTQFGIATVTAKNIGKLEASYSLTFDCSKGVTLMEEQFFIMKSEEVAIRSFKLYLTTDQAAKYLCSAILKDSDFSEVDRADCQFTTTATTLDNGSQIAPFKPPKNGINGIFGSIQSLWTSLINSFIDFFTGRTCRSKCSGFFDFRCHIQYICFSWIVLFGLLLAIFPTVSVLLWLLHQKGVFDPLYDWWEDQVEGDQRPIFPRHGTDVPHSHHHHHKHHRKDATNYKAQHNRKSSHNGHHKHHRHGHLETETHHHHHMHDSHLHHVQKDRHKHTRRKNLVNIRPEYSDYFEEGKNSPLDEYHRHKKEKGPFQKYSY